jgi:transposase
MSKMVLRANCRAAHGLPADVNSPYRYGEPDPNPLEDKPDAELRKIDMEIAQRMQGQGSTFTVDGMWGDVQPLVPPVALVVESDEEEGSDEEHEEEEDKSPEYTELTILTGQRPEPGLVKIMKDSRRAGYALDDLKLDHLPQEADDLVSKWFQVGENLVKSYHDQFREIAWLLWKPDGTGLSLEVVGSIFHVSKSTARAHLLGKGWSDNPVGRPPAVTREEVQQIERFLQWSFDNGHPATYADVWEWIVNSFDLWLPMHTIYRYVHETTFRPVKGKPLEQERMDASEEAIVRYFQYLDRVFSEGVPAALVINLDETGHQEWVDTREEKVLVPPTYEGDSMLIGVPRNGKRSTLLGAIAVSGVHLKPLVIISRKTVDKELFEQGFTPDQAIYACQDNGFITSELFDRWCEAVLFPYIETTRLQLNYRGPAVVLLDGCSSHSTDYFLDECTWKNNLPVYLPPHSSDQTQAMDRGIFAVEKIKAQQCHPPKELNPQTRQVIKILTGYYQACAPKNVVHAIHAAGITTQYDEERKMLMAKVSVDKANNIRFDPNRVGRSRVGIAEMRAEQHMLGGATPGMAQ